MRIARRILLLVVTVACLSTLHISEAKKPGNPGKGGAGGGGFLLVRLPDASGTIDHHSTASGLHELEDDNGDLIGVEVVGYGGPDYKAHYWLVDASGTVFDTVPLPLPAGADPNTPTNAEDINDAGIIVGGGGFWPNGRPMMWPGSSTPPVELPVPEYADSGLAIHINNHDLVVGTLSAMDVDYVVAWGVTVEGDVVGPEVLGFGENIGTTDVNDAGIVVGTIDYQAYRWQVDWDGATLSTSSPEPLTAEIVDENGILQTVTLQTAVAVNEHGDICGRYNPDGAQIYLLTAEGLLLDMPSLVDNKRFGTRNYQISDLNDAADIESIQVVGGGYEYDKRNGAIQGFLELLWQGDQATDLQSATQQPDPELTLESLRVVSDHGWMAGYGWNADADPRAVILIPK